MSSRILRVALSSFTALDLISAMASADMTKVQCVKSNADAQSLRREGKFAEARAQLEMCGDPTCPGIVRADCAKRLDELEAAQPTIVLEVKDGSGRDVAAVTVLVDGRALVAKLDGTALPIDPGSHEFTFTVAGQRPVTQTFLLSEGQKGSHETILLDFLPPQSAPDEHPSSLSPPAAVEEPIGKESGGMATQKVLALAAGGVGVAGLAVGSIFGLMASSKWSQAQAGCGAACSANAPARTEESDARSAAAVSTVGFVAGGLALAAGAVLWFTAPPAKSGTRSARLLVSPSLGPAVGGVLVHGEF